MGGRGEAGPGDVRDRRYPRAPRSRGDPARGPQAADQVQVRDARAGPGGPVMARAKTQEIRDLPQDELEQRLAETKEELFNLRFQNATGQLDNYKRIGQLRKDVARIRTILRQ